MKLGENPNPTTVEDKDFIKLSFQKITNEDSIEVLKSGVKKNRFRS
jgi:hypothetical protein